MAFSVLVVDDSSVVRSRLTEMLSEIDGVTHVDDAPGADVLTQIAHEIGRLQSVADTAREALEKAGQP